ncbi:MAG: type II toxin-antitoxin system PemK/MazF family toxin [Limisphaerales bacterium]
MKVFDIFMWQPAKWPEAHPCVIISHPDRVARKEAVEVLMCSTKRAGREPEPTEFLLDQSDGLDWPTLCKCDLIYSVLKADLKGHKGNVSDERRGPLIRKLIAAHDWAAVFSSL